MKISIENLGPLRHAEFELKPLTVFIGDNRQGKTQAIVTAATMLSSYGMQEYISHYLESNEPIPEIEKLYKDILNTSHAEINLAEFSSKYLLPYYANLGKLTPKCLSDILGYPVPVEKTAVTYTPSETERTEALSIIQRFEYRNFSSTAIIKYIKERDSPILHLYVDANQEITLPKPVIINILLEAVLILTTSNNILSLDPYLFPSERAGFSLLLREIQKLNILQPTTLQSEKNCQNLVLPYALTQYMTLVHQTLRTGSSKKRLKDAKKYPKIAKIQELSVLFTALTQDIISLSSPEPIFPRKIQIQVHDTVLDVQAASSGVKGLIGLSLYLQYLAKPGDFIVIDEPEQNLHPNQQAAFVEFLTLLVNNDIRVAITTHSPYIIEHLQNLILAYDLKGKKEIIGSLYFKREDSFIDKEKVGVYLFQNGTAENILKEDGEINWQTFCDTADTIVSINSLIYDQQEKQKCRRKTPEMSDPADEPKER